MVMQGDEVVDIETGKIRVVKFDIAYDSDVIVNPITASGQIEGCMVQALDYVVCEEMVYDKKAKLEKIIS